MFGLGIAEDLAGIYLTRQKFDAQTEWLRHQHQQGIVAMQRVGSLTELSSMHVQTGECAGCGAPWAVHPLQNALAKGADACSYCRRRR
jgi:hypothetical protein